MICWNMKLTHNIYAYAFSEHSEFFKILVGINEISQSEFNKISFQKIILIANEFTEYIVWDSKSLVFFYPTQSENTSLLDLDLHVPCVVEFISCINIVFFASHLPLCFWMSNFSGEKYVKRS